MSKQSKIIYFFVSVIFFIIFDLFCSEEIINSRFLLPENSFFDLIYIQNTGAAFSILENSNILLIIFGLLAVIVLIIFLLKNTEKISAFGNFWLAMLVAGISCNLYERISFGYVRDFFKLNFIEFPIFNISDIFINISVFALIFIIIKNKYLKR